MLKRILAFMLCLVLLMPVVPMCASAATDEEHDRIRKQITNVYYKTLYASGTNDLHGYCGLMAGYELYFLGVTEIPITQNGNEMYDILSVTDRICDGFVRDLYPVSNYTLEEALNAVTSCGTRDAYNIMVGFQRTTTAAGSIYGHVTVIHAILDGVVYFTEGFSTPFNSDPSKAMVCTIEEFAKHYNKWTTFEGLIHFGSGNFVEGCSTYGAKLYVTPTAPVQLLSQPDALAEVAGRTVAVGERIYANALCRNEAGDLFYRVVEEGVTYYIHGENTKPVWFDYTDVTATNIDLPQQMRVGKDHQLSGAIKSSHNLISSLVVQIRDSHGDIILSTQIEKDGYMVDLSTNSVNVRVDISSLAEGSYTYEVCCNLVNHYAMGDQVIGNVSCVTVASQEFTVGEAILASMAKQAVVPADQTQKNGWKLEDGKWYYYRNGDVRVGWFCDNGIDYYLLEDGAAATGWQIVNGKARYFSETGAMRTGWLKTEEGSYYMFSNGATAVGLKKIDNVWYYFLESGLLAGEMTFDYMGHSYGVDADGVAHLLK